MKYNNQKYLASSKHMNLEDYIKEKNSQIDQAGDLVRFNILCDTINVMYRDARNSSSRYAASKFLRKALLLNERLKQIDTTTIDPILYYSRTKVLKMIENKIPSELKIKPLFSVNDLEPKD